MPAIRIVLKPTLNKTPTLLTIRKEVGIIRYNSFIDYNLGTI